MKVITSSVTDQMNSKSVLLTGFLELESSFSLSWKMNSRVWTG